MCNNVTRCITKQGENRNIVLKRQSWYIAIYVVSLFTYQFILSLLISMTAQIGNLEKEQNFSGKMSSKKITYIRSYRYAEKIKNYYTCLEKILWNVNDCVMCIWTTLEKNSTHFYMYRVYVTLYHEKIQDYVYNNECVLLYKCAIQNVFSI
jgi:hypothetical protein